MMNTNKRLNCLLTRMLSQDRNANESSSSSLDNTISNIDEPSTSSSTRRNLFGIRLNHDQLKQDLKEMWKEQMEIQKSKWNFDFEKLRPVNRLDDSVDESSSTRRYEWCRVNTYYQPGLIESSQSSSNDVTMTALDKDEMNFNHNQRNRNNLFDETYNDEADYEDDDHEEEDDIALAIPQFYKYQRRLKLNDNVNRIKYMNIANFAANTGKQVQIKRIDSPKKKISKSIKKNAMANKSPLFESMSSFKPIFQIQTTNTLINSNSTESSKPDASSNNKKSRSAKKAAKQINETSNEEVKMLKPKAIKRTTTSTTNKKTKKTKNQQTLKLSNSAQNLIITFSENRKDTLRSASHTTSNALPTIVNTTNVIANETNQITASKTSAFAPIAKQPVQPTSQANNGENLKQQTLLDLFKQRKRRNSSNNTKTSTIANKASSHFLRSHSNVTSN